MRAGLLRHRVTIQTQPTTAVDSYGAPVPTTAWFDNLPDVPAMIQPVAGNEYYLARQAQAAVSHKVTLRYMRLADGTRISPKCRVKFRDPEADIDRFFEIESVIDPEERHRELRLMCREKV